MIGSIWVKERGSLFARCHFSPTVIIILMTCAASLLQFLAFIATGAKPFVAR